MNFEAYNISLDPIIEAIPAQTYENVARLFFSVGALMWFAGFTYSFCTNPLAEALRSKLAACEDELLAAEFQISEYEDEIKSLNLKLNEMSSRYDNCRLAALQFMDTFPVSCDEPKAKRSRLE
uniref:Uncharacterized protein n=1 Tax=viral metagenome TaxID=1070528 RepID=A0A6C0EPW2_9ZZZZ